MDTALPDVHEVKVMNRWIGKMLCMALLALALPAWVNAARLVDLDAAGLKSGDLSSWANAGTLKGGFDAVMSGGAKVETVDGRKAVTFDGLKDFLKSSFVTPPEITGSHAWSVVVQVYNPKVNGAEEPLVYWAHRGDGSRSAHLNYGDSKASGAVVHWGADMGYDGVPAEGKWHFIVLTYAGGTDGVENLYVDGKLNATAKRTLNLFAGEPIYLGATDFEKFFSGSLAQVSSYDYALTTEQMEVISGTATILDYKMIGPVVWLTANDLPEGKLESWPNKGKLGGSFGLESSAPKVAEVDGKQAVTFSSKTWLQSTFSTDLAKGPYTVEYWIDRAEINDAACPVLSLGDRQTPEIARFSFSKAGRDGAFFAGSTRIGFKYPWPAAKKWHQIAYTQDAQGVLKLYLDGELQQTASAGSLAAQSAKLQIGAAWPARRGTPITAQPFSVAKLCVYDEALPQREIRNDNGQYIAFAPDPADKAATTGFSITLKWSEGDPAVKSVNVYFGANKSEVEGASNTSKAFKGTVEAGKLTLGPIPIDLEQTYYWRVDELGSDGEVIYAGDVWSFTSESGAATAPKPRTAISGVPIKTATLTWTPGNYATSQTVYFGPSMDDVKSGKAVLAKSLKATTASIKAPKLDYGLTYFWRVSNENGKHPASTGDVWSFRTEDKLAWNDVTFCAVSDLHYGASPSVPASNEMTIDFVNVLPGNPYPAEVGGSVMTPRGVVITGDLTNSGGPEQWALFVKDYGVNGEGRIAYPVYEGWGNHDGSLAPGAAVAPGIAVRNKSRVGVKSVSENGFHYSWDWDQLHMVELNFYAGDLRVKKGSMDGLGHEPQYSLKFLKEDLAKNVGKSGRPVIIMMHLGFDEGFSMGWGWWAAEERDAFYEAIKDYNVIGILYGHTHAASNFKWKGIDIYNCASGQRDPDVGECMVFHVTPKEMVVMQRFSDHWADAIWRKPIKGLSEKK